MNRNRSAALPALARALSIILTLTGLFGASTNSFAADVRLAVAANFTDTTRELIRAFARTTGLEASASYGSTGKLYAQIEHGAPFDVFMAADSRRPQLLEASGQGVAGTRFTYARGRLVLWSPESGAFSDGKDWLSQGQFDRLAIANPKTAPYGLAARQALTKAGLWQPLQAKLVRGDSIAQTFQFVASGNAQAGLIALSQALAWDHNSGTLWSVPQEDYAPIDQQVILLTRSQDKEAARQWLAFLASAEARAIISSYGYDSPSATP